MANRRIDCGTNGPLRAWRESSHRNQGIRYVSARWVWDCFLYYHYLVLLNKGHRKLKEGSKTIVENLRHLSLSRNGSGKYGDAPPLRSELLSAEQMQQHGRTLATPDMLSPAPAAARLLARGGGNVSVLRGRPGRVPEPLAANRQLPPAGE